MIIHNLWIKNFRNLKNQYFTFTGLFNISVKSDELNISISKSNVVDKYFYSPNISYVSGIIGKNGAGKSNLLELINFALFTPKSIDSDFVLVLESAKAGMFDEITVIYKLGDKNNWNKVLPNKVGKYSINYIHYSDFDNKTFNSIYFTNVFDGIRKRFPSKVIDLSAGYQNLLLPNSRSSFVNEIEFFNEGLHDFFNIDKPLFISVRPNPQQRDFQYLLNVNNDKFITSIRSKINKLESRHGIYYWILFFVFLDLVNDSVGRDVNINSNLKKKNPKSKLSQEDKEAIIGHHISRAKRMGDTENVLRYLVFEFPFKKLELDVDVNYFQFIEFVKIKFHALTLVDYEREGRYITRTDSYLIKFDNAAIEFMTLYGNLFKRGGRLNFSWQGISSGHKAFLNLFSRLLVSRDRINGNSVLLLIDEGDLYFHPQWQKEYVDKLIRFISEKYREIDVQLIVTSHSPFIASDIPISNLILLKTNEDEESNINTSRDFQTFGANIFELFTQAFFIKNGTAGEFADRKTKEIIDIIRSKDSLAEKKKLVRLIGDDFLKKYLTKHFIENDKAN